MTSPATIFLVLAIVGSASAQCLTGDDNPTTMNRDFKQVLEQARLDFAFETLKKTVAIESAGNVFYSPHSLYEALTLAYFGSRGKTEENLKRALHVPDSYPKNYVQRFYDFENSLRRIVQDMGNSSTSYEFRTANKLWVTKERKIRDCMLDLFGTQIERVDFKVDPESIRVRVNDWASNETKGHIRDLIPSGGVTEDSDLILANAVYFKGLWKNKFDPDNSVENDFYSSGSKIGRAMFMRQANKVPNVISQVIGAHVLQLPYEGDEVSMYVLLPLSNSTSHLNNKFTIKTNTPDSVNELIERITGSTQGAAELRGILDGGMPTSRVVISLPKFSMDKELPVELLLNGIGAGELLTSFANLTGFLADEEPSLHLGNAVHRAMVEVTEEGTTAVALTVFFSYRTYVPEVHFRANRPFLYFIYDKSSHSILFTGIFRSPPSIATTNYSHV